MRLTISYLKKYTAEKPKKGCQNEYKKRPCRGQEHMNLVTRNVLSLNRTGAFKKLKDELCKCKVATAAVQEFR
jgi:hypothetical protein